MAAAAIPGMAAARHAPPQASATSGAEAKTGPTAGTAPVTDPAFDRALPPLDALTPPADTTPPAPPATVPQAAAGPAGQTAAASQPAQPVATAAELAEPLPPLGQFDTTPPVTVANGNDSEPAKLRYTLAVEGLKAVDLEKPFRSLSALAKGGKKAANAAQVSARAANDVTLAERLLHSEGYLDGTATSSVTPVPNQPGQLVATITAVPGPRYRLGTVTVTQAPPVPNRLATEALDLHTGQPIVAQDVLDAEAHVSLRLPEQGYPFVTVGQRDVLLDPATQVGDYTLPVDAGPRSSFGHLRPAGDPVFGAEHLAVFPRFKPGELYDSRKLDDLRQALIATSLFSTVAIEPVRTGQINPDGTETVDLVVHESKGPWRNLSGSAGYETGQGIKLQGSWTNRNLFPDEGALILTAVAGTQEQGASATFRRSNAGKRDRTVTAAASIDRQKFDAYSAQTIDLTATIARASTPIWQKRWTYSYGAELLVTRENGFEGDILDHRRGTYVIAALPGQVGWDLTDSLLNPTKGYRVTLRASPEAQEQVAGGGGFSPYARLLVEGSTYKRLTDSLVLAGRARFGSILGISTEDLAPSRRYYAGGGGSVRGFGYQELGPKDADNNPTGGRGLTEFALEARYRFGNYGIVPFVDAGQLTRSSMPTLSGLREGVGIGGRYYTNFGPFRFDIATPLNRKPGESRIAVYIGIGQAF